MNCSDKCINYHSIIMIKYNYYFCSLYNRFIASQNYNNFYYDDLCIYINNFDCKYLEHDF